VSRHLPARKPKPSMNAQPPGRVDCEGHLGFVRRKFVCCLTGAAPTPCEGKTVAHHVQSYRAIEGGMGMKVGDHRSVPLCDAHHVPYVHLKGQAHVEKECGVNFEKIAAACWDDDDYHRMKFEREWKAEWPGVPLPYASSL
jgi:hypothetical protein